MKTRCMDAAWAWPSGRPSEAFGSNRGALQGMKQSSSRACLIFADAGCAAFLKDQDMKHTDEEPASGESKKRKREEEARNSGRLHYPRSAPDAWHATCMGDSSTNSTGRAPNNELHAATQCTARESQVGTVYMC